MKGVVIIMKLGFLGFGNMGQALGSGLILNGAVKAQELYIYDKYQDRLDEDPKFKGINICSSEYELVNNSDMVLIAVKPNVLEEVIKKTKEVLLSKVVVSIVVNVQFDHYEDLLIPGTHHISILPNMPVSVGEGVIVYEHKHSLTDEELKIFIDVFSKIALVQEVKTENLGIAGTITGCGPAFASMFIEALSDAAVKYGLGRELSYNLVSQMIVGTGKLQLESKTHPAIIKDQVSSPGGTTIKGVTTLEKKGFKGSVIDAIDAICEK